MRIRVHPGEILREEFGLRAGAPPSVKGFAQLLGLSSDYVRALLAEQCSVTEEAAAALSRWSGTSEQFWLNLQAAYDASKGNGSAA